MAEQDPAGGESLDALRAQCTSLKCSLQEALASKEAYTTRLKAKTKEVKEADARARQAEDKVKELEATLKLEAQKVEKLEANIHSLVAEKTELGGEAQSGRDDMLEQLDQRQSKILNLEDQIDELHTTVSQKDERILELTHELSELRGDAAHNDSGVRDDAAADDDAAAAPAAAAADPAATPPPAASAEAKDREYARDSQLLKEALEGMQADIDEREDEITALQQKLDRKAEDNLQLREVIANMQTRDKAQHLDPEADAAKRDTVLEELKAENHRLVSVIMELKKFEAETYNAQIHLDSVENASYHRPQPHSRRKQPAANRTPGGGSAAGAARSPGTPGWQVVDAPNDPYETGTPGEDPLKEAKESVHASLHVWPRPPARPRG